MTPEVRAFVEEYRRKNQHRSYSFRKLLKNKNHEVWRRCPQCGVYEDLRKNFFCPECGTQLDPNLKP